jgi:hypothetical protein
MVEFLGLKEFACGAPPAVARGATGAEKMASSVLSFLKCAAGNAGQQVIEQVKSIEDSLSHGGFNSTFGSMSKESDGDTRDQPEIEGTSYYFALSCQFLCRKQATHTTLIFFSFSPSPLPISPF